MKYKYRESCSDVSYFKAGAGQAGHSSHVQTLLLEAGLDVTPGRDERVLPMPGKLGIAHQDHVSSHVSECPLHQVTLPLVNIVKLCLLQSANKSDTNIT